MHAAGTTIILTTHYLDEAEELCDQIAIINHGEVIACEPTPDLLKRMDQRILKVVPQKTLDRIPDALADQDAELTKSGELVIRFRTSDTGIGRLLEKVRGAGISIADLSTEDPDLEDVFVALTSAA